MVAERSALSTRTATSIPSDLLPWLERWEAETGYEDVASNAARWGAGEAGILSGGKGTALEGGLRVPFLARWPGTIPAAEKGESPRRIDDPAIADKLMLVSVFIVLTQLGHIPLWLTILIVSRDVLIISGVLLAFFMERDVTIRPLWVSKANTLSQIVLAGLTLGLLAFALEWPQTQMVLELVTGILTTASAAAREPQS